MEGWLAQHNLLWFGNVIPKETDNGVGKEKTRDICSMEYDTSSVTLPSPNTGHEIFRSSYYIFQQEVILGCTGLAATAQRRINIYCGACNIEETHHVEDLIHKLKAGCSFIWLYMETITLKHSHQCIWLQSKSSMQTSQCFCLVVWEAVSLLVRTS